jgi:hypothetical protein
MPEIVTLPCRDTPNVSDSTGKHAVAQYFPWFHSSCSCRGCVGPNSSLLWSGAARCIVRSGPVPFGLIRIVNAPTSQRAIRLSFVRHRASQSRLLMLKEMRPWILLNCFLIPSSLSLFRRAIPPQNRRSSPRSQIGPSRGQPALLRRDRERPRPMTPTGRVIDAVADSEIRYATRRPAVARFTLGAGAFAARSRRVPPGDVTPLAVLVR